MSTLRRNDKSEWTRPRIYITAAAFPHRRLSTTMLAEAKLIFVATTASRPRFARHLGVSVANMEYPYAYR